MLFRLAQQHIISRTIVATVAQQDDYMRRVRGNGGSRGSLRREGIVIFGDYAGDQLLASALDLPRPGPGEFVSARLVPVPRWPADPGGGLGDGRPASTGSGSGGPGDGDYTRSIRLAGADWRLASAGDPAMPAPALPR